MTKGIGHDGRALTLVRRGFGWSNASGGESEQKKRVKSLFRLDGNECESG